MDSTAQRLGRDRIRYVLSWNLRQCLQFGGVNG